MMLKLIHHARNALAITAQRARLALAERSSRGTASVNEKGKTMKSVATVASIGMIVSLVGAAVAMFYPEVHLAFCSVR